jgi:hypothetical protein
MPRRLASVLVVLVVSAGTLAVSATAAHADTWQLSDGYELNPTTTWSLERYGVSSGGFELNQGTARTGRNNAYLRATTSFSALGRTVRITPTRHGPTCAASVYVQTPGGATVNFEVINPASWTYIRLTTVTPASTGSGWTLVSSPVWEPGVNGGENVVIRVALLGNGTSTWIRLDDLQVSCWNYYSS